MPRLNYVPSNRTLHRAWALAGIAAMLVFAGLTYAVISTAFQLQSTNARLEYAERQRAELLDRVRQNGVLLSFMDQAPDGLQEDITYRCRVKVRDQAYVCRPIPPP